MADNKDINLIAIKSLIEYIDNRDIAEGGVFLDDDNAEFVADILRYHYKTLTSENKMEQVAAMFGKQLGEEFKIRYKDENHIAYFRNEGLRVRGLFCLKWDNAFVALLTGEAVIVDE